MLGFQFNTYYRRKLLNRFCIVNGGKRKRRGTGDAGRCTKQRSKQTYGEKRKYHGRGKKEITAVLEDVVTLPNEVSVDSDMETVSLSKVVDIDTENVEDAAAEITGYRLIDTSVKLCLVMACPDCLHCETISLEDINAEKKGLFKYLCIKYNNCDFNRHFYSSKTVGDNKSDVYVRMVYGMRAIGRGYSSLK